MKCSKRLRLGLRLVLQGRLPHQYATILPDDLLVVSYPKSGNTWLRFLVANLLHPEPGADFTNIERLVPDLHKNTEAALLAAPRPRALKSHSALDVRYRRVLYAVRDPRDVAVSYYHYKIKTGSIAEGTPMEAFTQAFIAGRLDEFGPWSAHVGGWTGARLGDPDFLLLRYEDLRADPLPGAARIAAFLGLDPDPALVERAVARSSFERMRTLEQTQGDQWVTTRATRSDKPFMRSATPGKWRKELPEACARAIEAAFGRTMRAQGYPVNEPCGPAADGPAGGEG
jgi:hypothetical protein